MHRAQTTDEQSHPDATACSCILDRPLLLSRATDNPFNLKEWKVSCQQVKRKSSRRVEGTGKKDDQVRGYRRRTEDERKEGGMNKLETFPVQLASRRSVCISPFFFLSLQPRVIKSPKESRMRKSAGPSFQWRPTTIGWRRPDCRPVISSNWGIIQEKPPSFLPVGSCQPVAKSAQRTRPSIRATLSRSVEGIHGLLRNRSASWR